MARAIKLDKLDSGGNVTSSDWFTETVAGSGNFDVKLPAPPANPTVARFGLLNRAGGYTMEDKKVIDLNQFGDGYYSPNYFFSVDWNPNWTIEQRRTAGFTKFNGWSILDGEEAKLKAGERIHYVTENALNGQNFTEYMGFNYFNKTLEQMEVVYNSTVLAIQPGDHWFANIEISAECWPGNNQNGAYPGYSIGGSFNVAYWANWNDVKNLSVKCESDGQTRTWEQLANMGQGFWSNEISIRRANRVALMLAIGRGKSPQGFYSYGVSQYQGDPDLDRVYTTGVFSDDVCKVSAIGGDANGNITLNGRSYVLSGSQWKYENCMLDYYYDFYGYLLSDQDYQDIWVNKVAGTQNYPYLWSKLVTRHPAARMKGHIQANYYRFDHRAGESRRAYVTMVELMYEADQCVRLLNDQSVASRVPSGMGLDNSIPQYGDTGQIHFYDTPKPWISPVEMRIKYAVSRFYNGGRPGCGFHVFGVPAKFDLNNTAFYNHHLHSIQALRQIRKELQRYEVFFDNSTLVENPEVQIGAAGSFTSYDGSSANNVGGGTKHPPKPCAMLRYTSVPGGWIVLVQIAHEQGHNETRTDVVRAPGAIGGNMFKLTYKGKDIFHFEFFVSSGDNGQTYDSGDVNVNAWNKPGYGGKINNATAY